MKNPMAVVSAREYMTSLTRLARQAKSGDTIAVATMAFELRDPVVRELIEALIHAAVQGADVTLVVDAYTFIFDESHRPTGPHGVWPLRDAPESRSQFAARDAMLKRLRDAGGVVACINIPSSRFHVPHGGRSHIKAAVYNDHWWIGGCNLDDSHNLDVMVTARDDETAQFLIDTIQQIAAHGSVQRALGRRDIHRQLDETTELYIDVGVRFQSAIYRRALKIINRAQATLYFTCQFFPSGKTALRLARALRRGVRVMSVFNNQGNVRLGSTPMQLVQRVDKQILPKGLYEYELPLSSPFLHAKIVANEHEAMIGSHNYIQPGVWLGTAEIALYSTNKTLVRQAQAKVKEYIT